MIAKIEAIFVCDSCGEYFKVSLDPAYKPPENWCLYDCAIDAIVNEGLNAIVDINQICKRCLDKCTSIG